MDSFCGQIFFTTVRAYLNWGGQIVASDLQYCTNVSWHLQGSRIKTRFSILDSWFTILDCPEICQSGTFSIMHTQFLKERTITAFENADLRNQQNDKGCDRIICRSVLLNEINLWRQRVCSPLKLNNLLS